MRKSLNIYLLLLCSGIFTTISCEPEPVVPDQQKVYPVYDVNYSKSSNKTTALVSFYLEAPSSNNQQKIELTHPSKVTYNGDELVFDSNLKSYKKEFIGLVESNFIYTNHDQIAYSNEVTMVDSVAFAALLDSIPIQLDLYFDLNIGTIDSNESVTVTVNPIDGEPQYILTVDSLLSGALLYISSEDLTNLGPGLTLFTASRKRTISELDQTTEAGGEMYIEYETTDTVKLY